MTSTNTHSRVLVAARLSRLADKTEASRIERDEEAGRAWAEAKGAEVIAVTKDRGVSGSISPWKRPGLGPWLNDPKKVSQYDVIVASAIDRLGRSARDLDALKVWAEDRGKRLVVLKPDLVWPLPSGSTGSVQRILWSLLADLAEIERETITERISGGVGAARANGAFVGKAGFGYEVVGEKYHRTLQPVPALEATLREMIRQGLRGTPFAEIARWLNTAGVLPHQAGKAGKGGSTTSDRWSGVSVAQILRSTDLKGVRKESGRTHRFESLLTVAEWNELQAALPKGRHGPITSETPFLAGVIVCEKCGGYMHRRQSTKQRADGRTVTNAYYRCRGTEQAPSRCANGVSQSDIEEWVNAQFARGQVITDEQGHTVDIETGGPFGSVEIIETTTIPGDDHAAEIEEIEAEMRDAVIDHPERIEALRAERARLLALPTEPAQVVERPSGITVGEVWVTLDEEARRRYLVAAGVRVRVLGQAGRRIVGDPHKVIGTLQGITESV